MALTQLIVPYVINYDYGIVVDLATSSPMGKVVDGEVTGVTNAGGATVFYSIRPEGYLHCVDSETL